jgi:lysophospholipase L1-like esterase
MKTILCYGDSITFGSSPITGGPRHRYEDRWPTVLEAGLGGAARTIAEGLGGRTTVHDDWSGLTDRNGARLLPTILATHWPLDLVVIMLGTNDLKPFLGQTAIEASIGMRRLSQIISAHAAVEKVAAPKIIFVAPPHIRETDHPEMLVRFGGDRTISESRLFAKWYRFRAEEEAVGFFDAGSVAEADPADGVHLDARNTRAIGEGLVPVVKSILGL